MPIIKSAKKAARQAIKRTEHNQQIKKTIKASLKEFKEKPTSENFKKVQSEYDKAVKKNLISKNTAARRKAALAKFAKANSGAKATESAKPTKTVKATKTVKKSTTKKPAVKKSASTAKKAATKKTK